MEKIFSRSETEHRAKRQFTGGTWNLRETKMLVSVGRVAYEFSESSCSEVFKTHRVFSYLQCRFWCTLAWISRVRYYSILRLHLLSPIPPELVSHFTSSFFYGRKVLYTVGFLMFSFLCFYAILFCCLSTPISSPVLLHTHYPLGLCVVLISINSRFSFSRSAAQSFSTLCFRISILPSTNRDSPPTHLLVFYFVFSTVHQASLPTYRAYLYERIKSWVLWKTQCAERERKREKEREKGGGI